VKSLLLGSAAGLVAIAGAQAADLPVKAKPVQYVKICSLYGAGFYYIPGTDTCLKVGGFVRAEMNVNATGSFFANRTYDPDNPGYNWEFTRVRFGLTADARSQTAYGTLRSFVYIAPTNNNGAGGGYNAVYSPVGFIQWAGFTFGVVDSFFNFDGQGYTNGTPWVGSASGGRGMPTFAYTAQFGNGLSATMSLEDWNGHSAAMGGTVVRAGKQWPDLVGNLRVDQAWGSAQIMGALHNVHTFSGNAVPVVGSESNKMGYAVGVGAKFNLPMLGHGDYVQGEFAYAKGATEYLLSNINNAGGSALLQMSSGWPLANSIATGQAFDAVGTTAGGSVDLTDGWHITAGYEHHWDPMWKTSLYGSYAQINYSANASNTLAAGVGLPAGSNADFNVWQIGSRTVWTPVHNLDFSVDLVYSQLDTAFNGLSAAGYAAGPVVGAAGSTFSNKGFLAGIFRVQRNF
jgi:hypothetical protein